MSVSGTIRPNYNDFEEFILDLIGDTDHMYGLEYDFYCLRRTFEESERVIFKIDSDRTKEFNEEPDQNVRWSFSRDAEFNSITVLNVHYLRKSYYITVHSQFEAIWNEIQSYLHVPQQKINYNFSSSTSILSTTVKKHERLFDYNYIRNSFAHRKTIGGEGKAVISLINNGELKDIEVKGDPQINGKIEFEITHMDFINDYVESILNFLYDIVKVSVQLRT